MMRCSVRLVERVQYDDGIFSFLYTYWIVMSVVG